MITRYNLIESLSAMKGFLEKNAIPFDILQTAKTENPWFTDFYIQSALTGILTWFEKKHLTEFLASYLEPTHSPRKIAVIAAGNVPFVGFHDVLMIILSGNDALVKLSNQDKILMQWLLHTWMRFLPELSQRINFIEKVTTCDFLISTGSDTTATQIEAQYPQLPKLIRKHRFSVAILEEEPTETEAQQLAEDILLYNGLGCRNVSVILTLSEKYLRPIKFAIQNYPISHLNLLYQDAVKYQRAKLQLLGESYEDLTHILLQPFSLHQFAQMGVLGYVCFEHPQQLISYLAEKKEKLQCTVGKNKIYFKTQQPNLGDFADGVDTLALLLKTTL